MLRLIYKPVYLQFRALSVTKYKMFVRAFKMAPKAYFARLSNLTVRNLNEVKLEDVPNHKCIQEKYTNEKEVLDMYSLAAPTYDVMNDILSLGAHRIWRDIFIGKMAPSHDSKLLDVAAGTGAIAFRYLEYLNNRSKSRSSSGHVTVCDFNPIMLQHGQQEAQRLGHTKEAGVDIDWLCADAENLPIEDNTYTIYSVAFGIRTCTHIDKVLSEAYRVLKPGGRFMCLEFGRIDNYALQYMFENFYSNMFPLLGQLVAGDSRPYHYLVDSIRRFADQETFRSMIELAGFKHVTYHNLCLGACAIHSGFKL